MKLYITRHGQVGLNADYINGDATLPRGEMPLSDLGREQATLLGKFLAKRDFHGIILSSPFWRTMETAELIAQETGSVIYLAPWMHEILADPDWVSQYKGTPLEQLREWYPHIAEDATLEIPWWTTKIETTPDVDRRVQAGIDALLEQYKDTDEEILLVGHGASTGSSNRYLKLKPEGFLWNCCLFLYDTKDPRRNFGKHYSFLPGQMVTNNRLHAAEWTFEEDDRRPWGIQIPDEAIDSKEFKVLHIGDTHGATYPFYRQLIRLVKPDVIIHTGDTADEDKVSWDTSAWDSYCQKVSTLADILKEADCPVYWVPGNNDLPDKVAEIAPFFQIVEPDSVIEIEGQRFCLTHSREQITKEADIYLYGHGTTFGETLEDELVFKGKDAICLNALRSPSVITLPEKKLYHIVRPD